MSEIDRITTENGNIAVYSYPPNDETCYLCNRKAIFMWNWSHQPDYQKSICMECELGSWTGFDNSADLKLQSIRVIKKLLEQYPELGLEI